MSKDNCARCGWLISKRHSRVCYMLTNDIEEGFFVYCINDECMSPFMYETYKVRALTKQTHVIHFPLALFELIVPPKDLYDLPVAVHLQIQKIIALAEKGKNFDGLLLELEYLIDETQV